MQAESALRWDEIRLFLALYRKRTLLAAGASVALDASTLSRRLAALEEALGARLFDRTRDGLVPTAAAELLLPAAEQMALAHARFLRDVSGFERAAQGTVRLSAPPGLAERFIGPALVRLRKRHPMILVELDASTHFADLTRREADLALRTRRPQSGDLVSRKLGERRWTPMIQRKPSRPKPVKAWADLAWIGWTQELADFAPAKWLAAHVPDGAVALRTSHFSTQVAAVEAGLGAALLPPVYERLAAVAPVRCSSALAATLGELPLSETWLVGHRAFRDVPRIAAVWAFLLEEFAKFE